MSALRSLAWEGESLRLLDQTKLPTEITYLRCRDYRGRLCRRPRL